MIDGIRSFGDNGTALGGIIETKICFNIQVSERLNYSVMRPEENTEA